MRPSTPKLEKSYDNIFFFKFFRMLQRAQLNRCALRTGPHRRDLAGEPADAQPLQHGRGVAGRAGRHQPPLVQPQEPGRTGRRQHPLVQPQVRREEPGRAGRRQPPLVQPHRPWPRRRPCCRSSTTISTCGGV